MQRYLASLEQLFPSFNYFKHSWAPSFRRKGRVKEGLVFFKAEKGRRRKGGLKNPSQKEKWRKVVVLKTWEGRVRESLLKFSKFIIFIQKLAISRVFSQKIFMLRICVRKKLLQVCSPTSKSYKLLILCNICRQILLIRKIFEPFWTNPSKGRVKEGLLRFEPKFYPSEGRWRKRQKLNWEGRRRKKGKNLTLLCKKKEG